MGPASDPAASAAAVDFHAVIPDGVFVEETPDGVVTFHSLPGPRDQDVLAIAMKVARRVIDLVAADAEGNADGDLDAPLDDESAAPAAAQAAAIETRTLWPATPSSSTLRLMHRRSVSFDGFRSTPPSS